MRFLDSTGETDSVHERRGPKVKKRAAANASDHDAPFDNTASHEQALNLLADLSRNVPANQRKDQVAAGRTVESLVDGQSIRSTEHASAPRAQPSQVQPQHADSHYSARRITISPHRELGSLPAPNPSNEVTFQRGKLMPRQ